MLRVKCEFPFELVYRDRLYGYGDNAVEKDGNDGEKNGEHNWNYTHIGNCTGNEIRLIDSIECNKKKKQMAYGKMSIESWAIWNGVKNEIKIYADNRSHV